MTTPAVSETTTGTPSTQGATQGPSGPQIPAMTPAQHGNAAPAALETKSLARKARRVTPSLGSVTIGLDGRKWNPSLHPRDAQGRFIETGGVAKVWGTNKRGKVVRTLGRGTVELQFADGTHGKFKANRLQMVARPDGGAPTNSRKKVLDEDSRRHLDPKRGDGRKVEDLGDRDKDGILDDVDAAPDDPKVAARKPARPQSEPAGDAELAKHRHTLAARKYTMSEAEQADPAVAAATKDADAAIAKGDKAGASAALNRLDGELARVRGEGSTSTSTAPGAKKRRKAAEVSADKDAVTEQMSRVERDSAEYARLSSRYDELESEGAAITAANRRNQPSGPRGGGQRAGDAEREARIGAERNARIKALEDDLATNGDDETVRAFIAAARRGEELGTRDQRIDRYVTKAERRAAARTSPSTHASDRGDADSRLDNLNERASDDRYRHIDFDQHGKRIADGQKHRQETGDDSQLHDALDTAERELDRQDAKDGVYGGDKSGPDSPAAAASRKRRLDAIERDTQDGSDWGMLPDRLERVRSAEAEGDHAAAERLLRDAEDDHARHQRNRARAAGTLNDTPQAVKDAEQRNRDGAHRPGTLDTKPDSGTAPLTGEAHEDQDGNGVRGARAGLLEEAPAEGDSGTGRPDDVLHGSGSAGEGRGRGNGGADDGEAAERPAAGAVRGVAAVDGEVGRGGRAVEPRAAAARGAGRADDAQPGRLDAGQPARGARTRRTRGADGAVAPRFRPASQKDLAPKGERAKLAANLEALRTLRKVQAENRPATADEQRTLARWAGWGSVPKVFDENDATYAAERTELKTLLSDTEWRAASRNTLNAHYTDASIVDEVWKALADLGFEHGDVLEPGSGSGNFIGRAPEGAHMTGVELDPITAGISQLLYPDAEVHNESFGRSPFNDEVFDAVVGNVPFGNYAVVDPVHNPKNRLPIHDHFISKAVKETKPGGVAVVVTSSFTLDKQDDTARRRIFDDADLLGAVRLPAKAHADAAGTDVVTDVLVLRRRKDGEAPGDSRWLTAKPATHPDGSPVYGITSGDGVRRELAMSDYFTEHPENVLGTIEDGGYNGIAVRGDGKDVAPQLRTALSRVVKDAKAQGRGYDVDEAEARPAKRNSGSDRDGRIELVGRATVTDAKGKKSEVTTFEQVENGHRSEFVVPRTQQDELAALLEVRDSYRALQEREAGTNDPADGVAASLRKKLNESYDRYAAKYGPIGRYTETVKPAEYDAAGDETRAAVVTRRRPGAVAAFMNDEAASEVLSLEKGYDAVENTATKADVFEKRQLGIGREVANHADTPEDAIALAGEHGGLLNTARLAELMGVEPEAAREAVRGLAFTDPAKPGTLVPKVDYLSGNVRKKLAVARAAAEANPDLAENVAALEEVLPADATIEDLPIQLGATWIEPAVVTQFAAHLMDGTAPTITYENGQWAVAVPKSGYRNSVLERETWGTDRRSFHELLEIALKQQHHIVKVYDTDPETKERHFNKQASEDAQSKANEIIAEFQDWVWGNADVADRLSATYTERFRSVVLPDHTGSRMRAYPGMTDGISLRGHQNDAVTRAMSNETELLEHVVGSGKTYTLAAIAMELRRTGQAKKPVLTVPNHMLDQWVREFRELYPGAKILAVDGESLEGVKGRKQFAARAQNNDWDVVVMTHTAFESVPVSEDAMRRYLERETSLLRRQLLGRMADARKNNKSTKTIEKQIAKLEARIEEQIARRQDRDGISFEDLGFDYVLADEAHVFKNLDFPTSMQGITSPEGAGRARDMHMKLSVLREHAPTDGTARISTFATGTPISNSLTEMYTMTRFMRPDLLEDAGIEDFDAWAATLANVSAKVETDTAGSGFTERIRMRGFSDALGDGLRIWRTFADTRTKHDLDLPTPAVKGGGRQIHVVPRSEWQSQAMDSFKDRVEMMVGRGRAAKGDDTHVAVIGDGRRSAIDPRLMSARGLSAAGIDPSDDFDSPKLDRAADNIAGIWAERRDDEFSITPGSDIISDKHGSLQMVMIDSSAPRKGQLNAYDMLRDRLVERGMQKSRIAFIQDYPKASDKARLFEAARQGDIDVIFGSSAALGTGTNVQNRLYAMHHIDGSWKPSDIEQREGRILRQGNQHDEVELHVYVTQDTHDVKTWDMVAYKQAGLDAIASGDVNMKGVEFADDVDPLTDYDEITGSGSSNPLVAERREVEGELKRLQGAQRSHLRQIKNARSTEQSARANLARLEQANRTLVNAKDQTHDVSGDKFELAVLRGNYDRSPGATATSRQEAADSLGAALSGLLEGHVPTGDLQRGAFGKIGGLWLQARTVNERGLRPHILLELATERETYAVAPLPLDPIMVDRDTLRSGMPSVITKLEARLRSFDTKIEGNNARQAAEQARLDAAAANTQRTFRFADDLVAAERRKALLDVLLTADDSIKPAEMAAHRAEYDALTAQSKTSGPARVAKPSAGIVVDADRTPSVAAPRRAARATPRPAPDVDASEATKITEEKLTLLDEAQQHVSEGDFEAAVATLEKVEALPDVPESPEVTAIDRAAELVKEAGEDHAAGRYDDAIAKIDQARAIDPEQQHADRVGAAARAAKKRAAVKGEGDTQAPADGGVQDEAPDATPTRIRLPKAAAGEARYGTELDDEAGYTVTADGNIEVTDPDNAIFRLESLAEVIEDNDATGQYRESPNTPTEGRDKRAAARGLRDVVEKIKADRGSQDGAPARQDSPTDEAEEWSVPDGTDNETLGVVNEIGDAIDEGDLARADAALARLGDTEASQRQVDKARADIAAARAAQVDVDPTPDATEDVMAGIERHTPEAIGNEKFPPTQQQQDVIDAVLAGKNLRVQAKAGSGKTTTLEATARRLEVARPDDRVIYIAFNKSVQTEAEGRMPSNVESRTGHSIAYAWAPDWMKDRTRSKDALRRPDDVARQLGISEGVRVADGPDMAPAEIAQAAVRTVGKYANSADDKITAAHLPESVQKLGREAQAATLRAAVKAWADLQAEDGKLRLTLDHVRKQWALSRPDLTQTGSGLRRKASVLFIDEAQDTPPVLAKVVADQKMQKVFVGDADQAIYGFTDAIDFLSTAEADLELPLNKSWRFGPPVADIGNRFLQLGGSKDRVEGGGESEIVRDMTNPDAVLVRTNSGMFDAALVELENGRTVGVPKGTKRELRQLVDTIKYLRGEGARPETMHDDLAAYRTWDEVKAEAEKGDDAKLATITRLVDSKGVDQLDQIVAQLVETGDTGLDGVQVREGDGFTALMGSATFGVHQRLQALGYEGGIGSFGFSRREVPGAGVETRGRYKGRPVKGWLATGTPEQREAAMTRLRETLTGPTPDVIVSTAHKAKGLEWDRVKIADDFRGPREDRATGVLTMPDPEELRLDYVAVTRAAKELDPGGLDWVYRYTDENGTPGAQGAEGAERISVDRADVPTSEGINLPGAPTEAPAPGLTDARGAEGQLDGQQRLDVSEGDLDADEFFLQPSTPTPEPDRPSRPQDFAGQSTIDDLLAEPDVTSDATPDVTPDVDLPSADEQEVRLAAIDATANDPATLARWQAAVSRFRDDAYPLQVDLDWKKSQDGKRTVWEAEFEGWKIAVRKQGTMFYYDAYTPDGQRVEGHGWEFAKEGAYLPSGTAAEQAEKALYHGAYKLDGLVKRQRVSDTQQARQTLQSAAPKPGEDGVIDATDNVVKPAGRASLGYGVIDDDEPPVAIRVSSEGSPEILLGRFANRPGARYDIVSRNGERFEDVEYIGNVDDSWRGPYLRDRDGNVHRLSEAHDNIAEMSLRSGELDVPADPATVDRIHPGTQVTAFVDRLDGADGNEMVAGRFVGIDRDGRGHLVDENGVDRAVSYDWATPVMRFRGADAPDADAPQRDRDDRDAPDLREQERDLADVVADARALRDRDAEGRDRDADAPDRDEPAGERDADSPRDDEQQDRAVVAEDPDEDEETSEERARREAEEDDAEARRRGEAGLPEENDAEAERRRRRSDDRRRRRRRNRRGNGMNGMNGLGGPSTPGLPRIPWPHLGSDGDSDSDGRDHRPDPSAEIGAPAGGFPNPDEPRTRVRLVDGELETGDGDVARAGQSTGDSPVFDEAATPTTVLPAVDETVPQAAPSVTAEQGANLDDLDGLDVDALASLLGEATTDDEVGRILAALERIDDASRGADLHAEVQAYTPAELASLDRAVGDLLEQVDSDNPADVFQAAASIDLPKPTSSQILADLRAHNRGIIESFFGTRHTDTVGDVMYRDDFAAAVGDDFYRKLEAGDGVPASLLASRLRRSTGLPGEEVAQNVWGLTLRELAKQRMTPVRFPNTIHGKQWRRDALAAWEADRARLGRIARNDDDTRLRAPQAVAAARAAAFEASDGPLVPLKAADVVPGDLVLHPQTGEAREVLGVDRIGGETRLTTRTSGRPEVTTVPDAETVQVSRAVGEALRPGASTSLDDAEHVTVDADGNLSAPMANSSLVMPDSIGRYVPEQLHALNGLPVRAALADGRVVAGDLEYDGTHLRVGDFEVDATDLDHVTLLAGRVVLPDTVDSPVREMPVGARVRLSEADDAFGLTAGQHVTVLGVSDDGHALVDIDGRKEPLAPDTAVRGYRVHTGPLASTASGARPGEWTRTPRGTLLAEVPGHWTAAIVPNGEDGYAVAGETTHAGPFTGHVGSLDEAKDFVARELADADVDTDLMPRDRARDVANRARPVHAPEEAPEAIDGQGAEWVVVTDLSLGDKVRIYGSDDAGRQVDESGYALGNPQPVSVTRRGSATDEAMVAVVVGRNADGTGPRKVVYAPLEALAARAVPEAKTSEDSDVLNDVGEADVLTGRMPDFVPVDGNGTGMFPGSLVRQLADGREGRVTASRGQDVTVVWDDAREDDRSAAALEVIDGGALRPAGWTSGGRRLTPGAVVEYEASKRLQGNGSYVGVPGRGTVEHVTGDQVTVSTSDGVRTLNGGDLTVVTAAGSAVDTTVDDQPRIEDVTAGASILLEPVDGPVVDLDLPPHDRRALASLGFDADEVSEPQVQQAAARVATGAGVTPEQVASLADATRAAIDEDDAARARSLRRLADRLDTAADRGPIEAAPSAEPVEVADVIAGDTVAIGGPDSDALDVVHVVNPSGDTWDVEDEDGVRRRIEAPDEAHLLPDMPDAVELDGEPADVATDDAERVNADSFDTVVAERARTAANTTAEFATMGVDGTASIHELRESVAARLTPEALERELERVAERMYDRLDAAGLVDQERQRVLDDARTRADEAVDRARQAILATINDLEPIHGEDMAATRARAARAILAAGNRAGDDAASGGATDSWVDDGAERDLLDWLGDGEPGDPLPEAQKARLTAELNAIADQHTAAALKELTDGIPDGPVTPEVIAEVQRRARALADRPAPRRVAAVHRSISRAYGGQPPKGLNAVERTTYRIGYWLGSLVRKLAESVVRGLRALIGKAVNARREAIREGRAAREARALTVPVGRHISAVRPDAGRFGLRAVRQRRWGKIARRDLPNLSPAESDGWTVDRLGDDGPGRRALGHLQHVAERGARLDADAPTRGYELAEAANAAERSWRDAVSEGMPADELAVLESAASTTRRLAAQQATREAIENGPVLLERLAEVRPMGETDAARLQVAGDPRGVAAVRWAAQFYPSDWIASLSDRKLTVQVGERGEYDPETDTITVAGLGGRGDAGGPLGGNALHELAHAFEDALPELGRAQWAYHWNRTSKGRPGHRVRRGDNAARSLADLAPTAGHDTEEFARVDGYPVAYFGREYDGMTHYELLAMTMQSLFAGMGQADPSLRQLAIGMIADLGRVQ